MIPLGFEGKTYRGTAGSTAATEITNIKNCTLQIDAGEADATTRASNGWKWTIPGLFDASIDFEMVVDTEDPNFTAIQTAFFARTPMAFLFLDEEGGEGLDADFAIMGFSKPQETDQAQTVKVTLKPTYSTRAPAWYEGT